MEPYKLKETRRFVIGICQSLIGLVIFGVIFFSAGWIVKIVMAILCILPAYWLVYSWKAYKCLKAQTEVYYALVIDENGMQMAYYNGDVVLSWDDISGVRFLRKKENGVQLGLLVVNQKNGEEVIFNLCRHAPINYFRIRRAIRYFSRREDIILESSNLLLMCLRS